MTGTDPSTSWAVDVHAHLLTADALAVRPTWAQPQYGPIELDEQLRRMDGAGVERALLLAPKVGRKGLPGSWRLDPEIIARAVAAHPDRFAGVVGLDPYDGLSGVLELQRYVLDHGFVGAQVYPHWFGLSPQDAAYYPFYSKCRQLQVPVQVHVGAVSLRVPDQRLLSVSRPGDLDVVACDFPDLAIVATHGAWPWAAELVSVADKHDNVSVVLGRCPALGWDDAVSRYAASWGKHKVLLSGGAPHEALTSFRDKANQLLGPDAAESVRTLLLTGNAVRVYG